MSTETATIEVIEVEGDSLLTTVKELVHEANVRRIKISNEEGDSASSSQQCPRHRGPAPPATSRSTPSRVRVAFVVFTLLGGADIPPDPSTPQVPMYTIPAMRFVFYGGGSSVTGGQARREFQPVRAGLVSAG